MSPTLKPIQIAAYNPVWVRQFVEQANLLRAVLGNNCTFIHHIGSTAVPGLASKPVIDVIPVVKDILLVDTINNAMKQYGFSAKGEYGIPFRRYFQKRNSNYDVNVHIYEENNPEIERHLLFREYLIHHPDAKKAYADLKMALCNAYPYDIDKYCLGKESFIIDIENKTGFNGLRIVKALTPNEWRAYHRIRTQILFEPIKVVYDPNHWSLSSEDHYHFVFIKGTTIIGTVQVELLPHSESILRTLAIDTPFQNQGYGTRLLAIIEKWIRQQGHTVIYLHSNLKAVHFYKKFGFHEIHFIDPKRELTNQVIDMGKFLKS